MTTDTEMRASPAVKSLGFEWGHCSWPMKMLSAKTLVTDRATARKHSGVEAAFIRALCFMSLIWVVPQ